MARVTVAVNVRDMTRGDLRRIRSQMDGLTRSINRFTGNMSQRNLRRMTRDFENMSGRLNQLRGRIPTDEFNRMNLQLGRMRGALDTTIGPVRADQLSVLRSGLRDVNREMSRMSAGGGQSSTRQIRITARDDTEGGLRSATRRISRWAVGPLRGIMGLVSGTLRDGIGQGLVGAFKSPTFGVILVGAIMAALSMVGAALAGVLVLAIGGAFVGLGMYIAAKSKEFTTVWQAEIARLKPLFKEAAEPMIPVLQHAARVMGSMGAEFAPKLKESLEKAAPTLNGFIDATKRGFQKLGKHAWDDLQEAFRVFLTAFGPEWEDFLAEFGKSLGALARTVSSHSTEIAAALRAVLGIINFLVDAINFFANAWVLGMHFAIDATAFLLEACATLTDGFLGMIEAMLGGIAEVADLIGMGDAVRRAQSNFATFRDDVTGKIRGLAGEVRLWGEEMDRANKTRKLQVEIDAWQNQLRIAKEELNSVPPEKRSELKAKIDDLTNKISQAQGQLNGMQKDYYVRIHAYKVGDWALGGGGPQAHGGVTGHWGRAATGGARSNMTLVGEQGPELIDLAPGSHVRSNADSRRLMAQGSGGGNGNGPTTLIIKADGSRASRMLLELLRDAIHDAGGDPVRVLGG